MNQEQVALTYELITNPILRLLVYFLSAAVAALTAALVYVYRERSAAFKELLELNDEHTKTLAMLHHALEGIADKLDTLEERVTRHLIHRK
jgi:hypothetical protein